MLKRTIVPITVLNEIKQKKQETKDSIIIIFWFKWMMFPVGPFKITSITDASSAIMAKKAMYY